MNSFQNRTLRIINISKEKAYAQYNITSIDDLIEKTNLNTMDAITADHNHPLTKKLIKTKRLRQTRSNFNFAIDKPRTTAYANNFIQKYLRSRRDGTDNLYTNTNQQDTPKIHTKQSTKPPTHQKRPIPKVPCSICNKNYSIGAGMANHMKTHRKTIQ